MSDLKSRFLDIMIEKLNIGQQTELIRGKSFQYVSIDMAIVNMLKNNDPLRFVNIVRESEKIHLKRTGEAFTRPVRPHITNNPSSSTGNPIKVYCHPKGIDVRISQHALEVCDKRKKNWTPL